MNRGFWQSLGNGDRISCEKDFRHAVVGGIALAAYGLPRLTLDLDLVVEARAQDDLIQFLESLGYKTASSVERLLAITAMPIRRGDRSTSSTSTKRRAESCSQAAGASPVPVALPCRCLARASRWR